MAIRLIRSAEIDDVIEALGETFTESESSFQSFESKYLAAYEVIFDAVAQVAVVKESPSHGEAEITMSKWIEPSRAIGIVIDRKSGLKPDLIPALQRVLGRMDEKFAVVLDDYPTVVYVLPDGDVLVHEESLPDDLQALGIAKPA